MTLSPAVPDDKPDISVIICFHNEDFIAGWTLDCVQRMRAYAHAEGFKTELICILDRADTVTSKIASEHGCISPTDHVVRVNNGDPGSSRNDGVAMAQGEFIAIIDGDDYCSENWLAAAGKAAQSEDQQVIFHPDYIVSFGENYTVTKINDMRRDKCDLRSCLTTHPWVSTAFGKRQAFLSNPYHPTDVRRTGFGYEDWEWNLRILAAGYLHLSVTDTALFYRRKRLSVLTIENDYNAVVRPNPFFDAAFQRRLQSAYELNK